MLRTILFGAVLIGVLLAAVVWRLSAPDDLGGAIESVELARDPTNALRGTLSVRTRDPALLRVELTADDHGWRIAETVDPTTDHEIPLLQLLPETEYEVSLEVIDADGSAVGTTTVGSLTTSSLPEDLPPIQVDVARTDAMTPGLTLFNSVYRDPPNGPDNPEKGFLTAVDEEGRIVWYYRSQLRIGDVKRLPNGFLLHASAETGARLITTQGEALAEWRGSSPATDEAGIGEGLSDGEVIHLDVHSIHHEVGPTADGNLVGLSREMRTIRMDDPCDDSDTPTDVNVVGDSIVVFSPATGEVLAEHSLLDVVDPTEDADQDLCTDFLNEQFGGEDTRDWSHGNAVIAIDDGRTWLASFRHLDELIAFRAVDEPSGPAGSIRWRMGPTATSDFRLVGDGKWFWHQHAPELEPDGTLMVYDNGNGRTDAPKPYSRAVRYELDTEEMTVRQVWEHRMPDNLYASFLGDADLLEGTVLITHGGLVAECPLQDVDANYFFGKIVEVDEASGDIVWQITTRDEETCTGWAIYRADRLPTLYPPRLEVTPLHGS